MANTRFQHKRSSISNVVPTTADIATGELGLNLADRKLFTSNGSVVFELGSNLTNLSVTSNLQVITLIANGTSGSNGNVLLSNGSVAYWGTIPAGSGTVTQVNTGIGLTGGPITTTGTVSVLANNGLSANATGIYVVPGNGLVTANSTGVHVGAGSGVTVNTTAVAVLANTGIVANATGTYVNAAYIATIAANSATGSLTNTFTVGTAAYFVANGNLGIGTSTPQALLHSTSTLNNGDNRHAAIIRSNVNNGLDGGLLVSSFHPRIILLDESTNAQWTDLRVDTSGLIIGYGNNTNAFSRTGEYMRITAGGNVGIGNTAPAHKLRVDGNASLSNNLTFGNGATLSFTGSAGLWLPETTLSTSATGETSPRDIFFKPDGLKMYITGSTTDTVQEFDLTSAWDISTATYTANVATGEAVPDGIFFKPEGDKMFVVGSSGDAVREFDLSTAWSVNTATFVGSFSVSAQETGPTGVSFSNTGTQMFIIGTANDRVFEYDLSTPWVVNTAVYNSQFFSVAAQDLNPFSVNFNSTGTRFFVTGITSDSLYWYDLSTPWSVNTAIFNDSRSLGNDTRSPLGVWVEESQNRAWIADDTFDRIIQYTTNNAGLNVNSSVNHITGFTDFSSNVGISRNLHVGGSLTAEGLITTPSSLTVAGAVTFNSTTSAINLGTTLTTGALTIGGTTQTGVIQIGRSTANQTLSIANGATTSGNTKIVNIGTGGLSGSNTTINIGSSLGAGNVTINQPTTVSTNTFTVGTAAYFVANGNVGIGTSTPSYLLDVAQASNTAAIVRINQSEAPTTSTARSGLYLDKNSTNMFAITVDGGVGANGITYYEARTVTGQHIFFTNNTERMRIAANGNVGIGNTAPDARLAVTGTANISGNVVIGGTLNSGNITASVFTGNVTGTTSNATNLNSQPGSFYTNATNLATGTVPTARLGTGTANSTTFLAGDQTYKTALTTAVTSVASGSGLTGGPITTTGTLSVLANNGLSANSTGVFVVPGNGLVTANSTGVHVGAGSGISVNSTAVAVLANTGVVANATGTYVNAAYIATIAANSATGSLTNTFTVGTAAYFVANGNVGIGTSSPTFRFVAANSGTDGGWIYSSGASSFLGLGGYASASDGAATLAYDRSVGNLFIRNGSRDTQTNRVTLDVNGNVGIGNTAPDARLTVTGTANVSGNVVVGGSLNAANVTASVFTGNVTGTASNATNLNSQPGSFYTNASNLSTGTVAAARLTGSYTITASNATNLNSQPGSFYTNASNLSTGTVAAARLTGSYTITASNATNLNSQPGSFYTNATNLASGTVPTARLGSGTANSTTFLAGDQTYKTVSASGSLVNVQVFTSSGTYTRTSGATRAVVIAVGGGGGGRGSGFNANGGTGGTTSFGSHVTAIGGSGGTSSTGGSGGTGGSGATIAIRGQGGGAAKAPTTTGGMGGGQGGGQGVLGANGVAGSRGGGGSGFSDPESSDVGAGGGQGETGIKYITSGLGATETVTIGAGGTAGTGTTPGGAGGAGYIIVYEYS